MRSGNSALQQTLTPEAASVLKHSLVLARRRGHAQLTPLHVATTLLTLRLSSFKRACLKSQPHQSSHSHSHPLQCRALELCFNVALNRLPTTPTPLIHSQPSLSNALIAALKRAQAHQRRGSIEQQQQQQSLLTVKVELEQLIISILDDPSVSRVMREAGFSSTLVKNNIEEENSSVSAPNSVFRCYNSSGGVFSSPCSPSTSENNHKESYQTTIHNHTSSSSSFRQKHFLSAYDFNQVLFSSPKKGQASSDKDENEIKLGLTLHASSDKEQEEKLNCCEECVSNYEKEAEIFLISEHKKTLPLWLQSHTTEDHKKEELTELKRKWNRLCHCLHQNKQPQNNWTNSNLNNSSSSISFANNATTSSNLVPRFRRQQSCIIEFNFNDNKKQPTEPFIDSLERMEGKEVKITLGLGNDASGETVGNLTDTTLLQQEAHVCKLLQENVPWQSETIPSIAKALVDSKSEKQSNIKWLLLQGNDSIGIRRLVVSIAESVFGSADLLLHLDMLKKETSIVSFSEMVEGALRSHQKLVILIENVDFAHTQFMKFLSDGYETGKFGTLSSRDEKSNQVIFILTNGDTTKTEEQNQNSVMKLLWQITETKTSCLGHKRRAELDLFTNIKSLKIEEGIKGNFSRQSSFNTLDLNMKADEEIEGQSQSQSQSSLISNEFLGSIENKFEFNMNSARHKEMEEMFMSKIKGSFEEICGKEFMVNFSVDERVIEEICVGCYFFTNSLFEKWLKDIFQSSLETVNFGGKEGILFRLCWGGKEGDRKWDSGFKGSFLPKSIQVNYFIE